MSGWSSTDDYFKYDELINEGKKIVLPPITPPVSNVINTIDENNFVVTPTGEGNTCIQDSDCGSLGNIICANNVCTLPEGQNTSVLGGAGTSCKNDLQCSKDLVCNRGTCSSVNTILITDNKAGTITEAVVIGDTIHAIEVVDPSQLNSGNVVISEPIVQKTDMSINPVAIIERFIPFIRR